LSGPFRPRDPDEESLGSSWPEHDLDPQPPFEPDTAPTAADEAVPDDGAGTLPPTDAAQSGWDPRQLGERRRPTTAEQAVPWLVGAVLALAGIVIVLLALIFSDANGGFGGATPEPTPLAFQSASTAPSPSPSTAPSSKPTPSVKASPAPTKPPSYGSLEMLYLTRPTAFAASELLRDDFASSAGPVVVASSSEDVTRYAAAPDGTVSVAIVNRKLLALARGKPHRTLANSADAATFGADASTVYVVRITKAATNDVALVTAITFATGKSTTLTTISYRHPTTPQLSTLGEARFLDDGGAARIFATSDGNLLLWVANAGQWRVDPVNGSTVAASRAPILWAADGSHRIALAQNGSVTTLSELDQGGRTVSRTSVAGLISHLRWSPRGNRVAFTLGITLANGGVRQDLYTWDLVNARPPEALTTNGASFGVEWLGSAQFWQP
jgi:hypothetical protein